MPLEVGDLILCMADECVRFKEEGATPCTGIVLDRNLNVDWRPNSREGSGDLCSGAFCYKLLQKAKSK